MLFNIINFVINTTEDIFLTYTSKLATVLLCPSVKIERQKLIAKLIFTNIYNIIIIIEINTLEEVI